MPPSKANRAAVQEVSNFDTIAATKAKLAAQTLTAGRGKRNGILQPLNGNGMKEALAVVETALQTNGSSTAGHGGIQWTAEDPDLLERYRFATRLAVPSSLRNPMAQCILNSGIGMSSPTMARQRSKRRISKEQLALVARKNFNAQPVNENEAIVELLYRIRTKERTFRIRFPAVKSK